MVLTLQTKIKFTVKQNLSSSNDHIYTTTQVWRICNAILQKKTDNYHAPVSTIHNSPCTILI